MCVRRENPQMIYELLVDAKKPKNRTFNQSISQKMKLLDERTGGFEKILQKYGRMGIGKLIDILLSVFSAQILGIPRHTRRGLISRQ